MKEINHLVKQFFINFPEAKEDGRIIDPEEFEELPRKIRKRIPDWYKNLLSKYPLAGLELGIPNDFGQTELIGKPAKKLPLMEITINDVSEIKEFGTRIFPAFELIKDRYICFAKDEFSTGEGIYFKSNENDPATYLVFHDVGESNKELIKNASILTKSFTDLFRLGKVSNFKRKISNERKVKSIKSVDLTITHISQFLQKNISSSHEEHFEKMRAMVKKSNDFLEKGDPSQAIQAITDSIHEFKIKIPNKLYELAAETYESCGLHVGELCYMENLKDG